MAPALSTTATPVSGSISAIPEGSATQRPADPSAAPATRLSRSITSPMRTSPRADGAMPLPTLKITKSWRPPPQVRRTVNSSFARTALRVSLADSLMTRESNLLGR